MNARGGDRLYIVGNWKMNGLSAALSEIEAIDAVAFASPGVEVAICPPFTAIAGASTLASTMAIGAQDCHAKASGAHTGCVSADMLKEAGAAFSIVGHSERRADQHETSAEVKAKAEALAAAGMGAILCVGEPLEVRDAGHAIDYVTDQLLASLPESADFALTIAYEPVWAIGTGRIPSMDDIAAMHAALRTALTERYGEQGAAIRILYGGSVNGDNAADILALPDVGGALVGGASLTSEKFAPIIHAATSEG